MSGLRLPLRPVVISSVIDFFSPFRVCDRFITFRIRIDRAFSFYLLHSILHFVLFAHAISITFFILYFARRILLKARAFALGIFRDLTSRDKIASFIARVEKLRVDFRVGTIRINCANENSKRTRRRSGQSKFS